MTETEATHWQILQRWLAHDVDPERARMAAAYLADKAVRALGSGPDGEAVLKHWPLGLKRPAYL